MLRLSPQAMQDRLSVGIRILWMSSCRALPLPLAVITTCSYDAYRVGMQRAKRGRVGYGVTGCAWSRVPSNGRSLRRRGAGHKPRPASACYAMLSSQFDSELT